MKKNSKRVLTFFVLAVFMFSSFISVVPIEASAQEVNNTTKITILGTSDIHGVFMPWDYSMDAQNLTGSLTQIYTAVKEVRAANPNTILVDVGDMIQGNSVELLTENEKHPMMVAMNKMGYETFTMGNHEFDFGMSKLEKVTKQFNGQLLGGNIYNTTDGTRYMPAYKIIEKDGIKVALIGMTTPMVMEFAKGTDRLKGVEVRDPVIETRKVIDELKGKVDVMIGVMHMGKDNENAVPNTGVTDIANACPELTAIIAGHMHAAIKSEVINGVLITEPSKYGQAVSRVDLTFKKDNGKVQLLDKKTDLIDIKGKYASDKELEELLTPYHELLRADANTKIGELKGIDMVPKNEIKGIPSVQVESTPLTRFFNEVQLYYSKADAVAVSLDNDKALLNVGEISKKDIAYNYQYAGGETTVYEVTGKDLKDYMEWSVDYFNTLRDGDVTVSFNPKRRNSKYSTNDIFGGITYKVDLKEGKGNRIKNVVLKSTGKEILLTDTIKLGLNSYRMDQLIAKGGPLEGRKFNVLWSSKVEYGEEAGTIRNRAIDYIKNVKKGIIEAKDDKNWEIVGVDKNLDLYKVLAYLTNNDIIEVPKTEDGKYTNVASINSKDLVTKEEITALAEKVGFSAKDVKEGITKGEFYTNIYLLLNSKTADNPIDGTKNNNGNIVDKGNNTNTTGKTNSNGKAATTTLPTIATAATLPKTGSMISMNTLIVFGLMMIGAGIYFIEEDKKKRKSVQ